MIPFVQQHSYGLLTSGAIGYLSNPVLQIAAKALSYGRKVSIWPTPMHGLVYCVTAYVIDHVLKNIATSLTKNSHYTSEVKLIGRFVRIGLSIHFASFLTSFLGFSAAWNLPVFAVATVAVLAARGQCFNSFKKCCAFSCLGDINEEIL